MADNLGHHCQQIQCLFEWQIDSRSRWLYWIDAHQHHLQRYDTIAPSVARNWFEFIFSNINWFLCLVWLFMLPAAIPIDYSSKSTNSQIIDVDYNERFWWRETTEMKACYKEALYRGSPFPILSLAEYFTLHSEGFSWGMSYRKAGYYASIMLWYAVYYHCNWKSKINENYHFNSIWLFKIYVYVCRWSFTSWLLMNLLLVMVPRYGAYAMTFTGLCTLLTNCIYWAHLPAHPLVAHVEGSILMFQFGWNYWLVFIAGTDSSRKCVFLVWQIWFKEKIKQLYFSGLTCLFSGTLIVIIDMIFPNKFSTILEVDYDTPYDRHVIIEKSQDLSNFRRMIPKKEDPFSERFIRWISITKHSLVILSVFFWG